MYHNRGDLCLECPVFGTGGMGRTAIQIGRGKLGHIQATAPTGQHLTSFAIELNNWDYSYNLPPNWMRCLSSNGFSPYV